MGIKRNIDDSIIRLFELKSNSKNVIFCFAGYGYSILSPLLYYIGNIASQNEIDFFGFDCDYPNNELFQKMSESDQDKYFEEDIKLIQDYIKNKNYKHKIFAGKSMGTTIINRLLENGTIEDEDDLILLTPGNEWNKIIENIATCNNKILIIGGTDDKLFTRFNYSSLYTKQNIKIHEYEKCDHVLECNDIDKDLNVLIDVVKKMESFVISNA